MNRHLFKPRRCCLQLSLHLAADASTYGAGAVISHVYHDGSERPTVYAPQTLRASEKNYKQIEKEELSLIFGVHKFHQHPYRRKFILYTDHKPLTAILGPNKTVPPLAAACLHRQALLLATYNCQIDFKPTQAHANADGLSRLPLTSLPQGKQLPNVDVFNI